MFEIIKLPNGATIVLTKISQVRSLSIGVWIKAGVSHESGFPNGIAHFAEHMLFKGTKRRTSMQIAKEIEDIGGDINAFTSKELTCYYTKTLDEYAFNCLDLLSDIYFNSLIDENEILKEKNVINQEISMNEDAPDDLIHDLILQTMWSESNYGRPISGTKDSVEKISRKEIISYLENFYTAKNTVISIAGNFDRNDILAMIERLFVFPSENIDPIVLKTQIYTPDICYREKVTEQNHICIGYKGFNIFDERNYDIACFNSIFGNGMSSILFQRIREEVGLVYSIFSYNSSFSGGGSLIIYAGLDKKNTDLYFSEIDETIKKFVSNRISELELEVVKNKLRSNYILALESPSSLMNYAGSSMITKGYINSADDISKKIENISLDLMYTSIKTILDSKKSIALIGTYEGILSNIQ